jgi:hypothetical protein
MLAVLAVAVSCNRPAATVPKAESDLVQDAMLDLEKQTYIWDIEHTTFELEDKFGKSVLAALRQRDPVGVMNRLFRPGCAGVVLDLDRHATVDRGYLREESLLDGEDARRSVDAQGLAEHLCRYFDGFSQVKSAKCRVLALDAEDRRPGSGRWTAKLLIGGAGTDVQGAKLEFVSHHRVQCEFTGDAEIAAANVVRHWTVLDKKTRFSPRALFDETTSAVGLDRVDIPDNWNVGLEAVRQYHTQMAVEDYDRDGLVDIAVASANGRWRLLRNIAGKHFVDVTAAVRLPVWADEEPRSRAVQDDIYLATWVDVDNDGYVDLVLGDRLYHNFRGQRFEDITDISGLAFHENPRGCVVADYDLDGRVDLYVLYQRSGGEDAAGAAGWVGDEQSGAENELWRNIGNGRFVNVTESAGAGGGKRQSFAAAWLYANEDHYPDLYVANDFGTNVLLLNQGNGRFEDVSQPSGAADFATSMGVAAGDLTGDGESEIYVANMFSKMGRRIIAHVSAEDYPPGIFQQIKGSCAGNSLYTRSSSDVAYREISDAFGVNQVGWAYAPALADFDLDGFLDIYATAGFLSFQRGKPDG